MRKREREREKERAQTRRERERREIVNPETDFDSNSDEPKNRLRLQWTQKPTPLNPKNPRPRKSIRQTHSIAPRKPIQSNPENPFDCTILDPHRANRTTSKIVAPQHRSTQNRSFSCYFCWVLRIWVLFLLGFDEFGFCPWPTFVVLDPNSSPPTQLRCPHSSNPVAFLSLSLSIWPDLMNFFCCDLFLLCLFTKKWY